MRKIAFYFVLIQLVACQSSNQTSNQLSENVISSDVNLFWNAFDLIVLEEDSTNQVELLDSLYLKKGSLGLRKIIEVKNYSASDYVHLIRKYPKYWNSIRNNTLTNKHIIEDLDVGIDKLREFYPKLKPAKIYFTIGGMRTNGTTQDSTVLIGSELAMADSSIDISEFKGRTKDWLANYFSSNPRENIVLLNVHEYVHTQQKKIPDNLLHIVLYEGIAEFVSVKAMGVPSSTPAIEYGKNNLEVKRKFEAEMFYERTFDWLWSNSPNDFNVRDLGYYVGYSIAELHYENSSDKMKAIDDLIELDFENSEEVNSIIDGSHFFSKSIKKLKLNDEKLRPRIVDIIPLENKLEGIDPKTKKITFQFSTKLNASSTGMNYSELGEDAFPRIVDASWSEDGKSWTIGVDLEENTHYQFYLTENFRTDNNIPIMPYLVEFKTRRE